MRPSNRFRPCFEGLEERVVPAFNVSITNVATANVNIASGVFTPTASGANINVSDIQSRLNSGVSVVIGTGSSGAENGNIVWNNTGMIVNGTTGVALNMTAAGLFTQTAGLIQGSGSGLTSIGIYANNTITLSANITLGTNGTLSLGPTAGGVNQTGGKLTANGIQLTGGGTFTMNQTNAATNLAAAINGSINYKNTGRLTIGTVNSTSGISTNGNGVTIQGDHIITVNQLITTSPGSGGQLTLSGPVSLLVTPTVGGGVINLTSTYILPPYVAIGSESGTPSKVKVYLGQTLMTTFSPYSAGFLGGVRTAVGDVNGDGVLDIITAAGPGAGPHVKVFDGVTFAAIGSFYAFQGPTTPGVPYFDSGLFAAAGDVDGDGRADIVIGAAAGGGSHFKVFHMDIGSQGQLAPTTIVSQFAFAAGFNGGVRVAAGDLNGDGTADVAVAAGPGAGPHVKAFVYNGTSTMDTIVSAWAFAPPGTPGGFFNSGMYIAAGDVDGDHRDELFVGAGRDAGPHVKVFRISGSQLTTLDSFYAFSSAFLGGVRVGSADFDMDGKDEILVATGPGTQNAVRVFKWVTNNQRQQLAEISPFSNYRGGLFVS